MKHDFRSDPSSEKAKAFLEWIEIETANALIRDYGNAESTRTTIFLYVNRAYEAGLSDAAVGEKFGECIVRAGYSEADQEAAIVCLESLASIARQVHGAIE